MDARRWLFLLLLLPRSVARPVLGEEPKGSPRVVEEFDVDTSGDPLVVPIRVGGKSERFIVDTGCSYLIYDRSLQRRLGRFLGATDSPTLSGEARVEWFEAPAAYLGALDLRGAVPENAAPVACVDLGALRASMGEDVRGIIGCSFLRQHVVRLDPDRGKLSFLDSAGGDGGVRVPFTFGDEGTPLEGTPLVRVDLPGVGGSVFAIDSGCTPSGALDEATTAALRRQSVLVPVDTPPAVGIGSEAPRTPRAWQVPFLTLGSFRHCDLVLFEHWGGGGGVLGLGYLLRYVVTWDFPGQTMYLRPSALFLEPDPRYRTGYLRAGIHIDRTKQGPVAAFVAPESPASMAGMRSGDILLTIDGRDVNRSRHFAIERALWVAPETVHVAVRRGSRTVDLTLRLPPVERTPYRSQWSDGRLGTAPRDAAPAPRTPSRDARAGTENRNGACIRRLPTNTPTREAHKRARRN